MFRFKLEVVPQVTWKTKINNLWAWSK